MTRALLGTVLVVLATCDSAHAGAVRDLGGRGIPAAASRAYTTGVSYAGGPVLHANHTHLIFWQPSGSGLSFDPGYQQTIETFLERVAADSHLPDSIYGVTGQYSDESGPAAYASSYAGSVIDTDRLPSDTSSACTEPLPPPLGTGPGWTACVNDGAIQQEISRVIGSRGLPTGLGEIYFLLTPNGLGDCSSTGPDYCALGGANGGYCGYHGVTEDPLILYAVIPYNAVGGHCQSENPRPNASTADPTLSSLAHEHVEIVTDPLETAWADHEGSEIADLCAGEYGPNLGGSSGSSAYNAAIHGGHYYLQSVWSNDDGRCVSAVSPDRVSVTVASTVLGDRNVTFTGSGSSPAGATIDAFDWTFGDGRHASGHRVEHAFVGAGKVSVTLRTTNSWANWGFDTRVLRVVRPPPPVSRITGAYSAASSAARLRFRFTSDAAIATFACRVDRGRWVACSSPYTTQHLGHGQHTFSVRATDTFGQRDRRAASYAFTVA